MARTLAACVVVFVLGAISSVSTSGVWILKSPMPSARGQHGAGVVDGAIYVVGGAHCATSLVACFTPEAAAYNPVTDTWTNGAATTARKNHAAAASGDRVYVFGGDDNFTIFNSVQAYHPATDSWSARAPMPTARSFVGAAALDGLIHVVGSSQPPFNQNEAYDPATNTWSVRASVPTPRTTPAVAALNGRVYVIGGATSTGSVLTTVEAYDPATDTWTTRAPLPSPTGGAAAVSHDGQLYVAGGFQPGVGSLTTVHVYDPATNSWSGHAPMGTGRYQGAAVVTNGVIYAIGGLKVTPAGAAMEYLASVEALHDVDTTPPVITSASVTPDVLWPPNHQMVTATVAVVATDDRDASPECSIASVSSSEPDNGLGDGDQSGDIVVDGFTVRLRAERSGQGPGRTYSITVSCVDDAGNASSSVLTVSVPRDARLE